MKKKMNTQIYGYDPTMGRRERAKSNYKIVGFGKVVSLIALCFFSHSRLLFVLLCGIFFPRTACMRASISVHVCEWNVCECVHIFTGLNWHELAKILIT